MSLSAPEAPLVEPAVVHDIAEVIRAGSDFFVVGHLRPDGDCLGSCLGLVHTLRALGKTARFYTDGPVPDVFRYLPGFADIETATPRGATPDAWLYVDSAGQDRVHDDWRPDGLLVNIDHHVSNTRFATHNWVDVEATAAAEQIYRLALALGVEITPDIATCLYTGILTDTGGFRFGNTDQMTFRAAAHLVRAGADPAAIAEAIFENRKPAAVRMTGEVYRNLNFEFGGRFVWAEATREMFDRAGGDAAEPEGLSSDLRSIEGVEVAILFLVSPEGWLRLGFRSKGRVDVSELARRLGGGGHRAASGAMMREDYAPARDRALIVIRGYLAEAFTAA